LRRYTVEYDPEADAAYVRLSEDKTVDQTVEFDEDVQADLDADGNVVGIEILHFSSRKTSLNELIAKGIENVVVTK
jgi:uncharacterized protein YuzE